MNTTLKLGARLAVIVLGACLWAAFSVEGAEPNIGTQGSVGCEPSARRLKRLIIDKPGVYENYLIDGEWGESTLVKITADNVTLRRCEIRHGKHNAINVAGKNVVIDACKIHHILAGTFKDQKDAHGITGCPQNLTIRNCDIGLTSGDSIQFDPGRGPWDQVTIENCNLWTGPLADDAGGFKKGVTPGENGVDTKQRTKNPRSQLTIRNCLLYGWQPPGQISNMAALNLKNHVEARVENCVFRDNEICLRVRGGTGDYGGALVSIENCAVYDSLVAIRAEDKIQDLKVKRLGIGDGVNRKFHAAGGGTGTGYEYTGEFKPPPMATVLKEGFGSK